jgi:hypothetical protein
MIQPSVTKRQAPLHVELSKRMLASSVSAPMSTEGPYSEPSALKRIRLK